MSEFPALDTSSHPKMYVLVEFPYPSGSGLHMGHAFSFTGGDIFARYQRMRGKNVLFPIGWDAFGLPTENYAIRSGRPPQEVTRENTAAYRRQMERMGLSFDWDRLVDTTDPAYYKWTQWIFIKLFEKGLAYKEKMPINWCPKDKIGLANEEVINGRCERCGTLVERRLISQWVVRITAYADRLISGLAHTDFVEKVKTAQINWIGRSEGARIRFPVEGRETALEVFTTRPDTLWGCTFMVVAPEHPLVETVSSHPEIALYVERTRSETDLERTEETREKDGVFSGLFTRHPATGRQLPIWISDFVLPTYGTGAIMAVPAHDERDHQFAVRYGLPVMPVVQPPGDWDFSVAAYPSMEGVMVNSGPIDGMAPAKAIPAAIHWLVERGLGQSAVSYHLRDWIFSRQHYWGEPIPMVYCEECGWQPVPEDQLPVILPEVEHYEPSGTGESPLATIPGWVETTCPKCSGPARRETDTMPNWAGSDWYFLRYTDPHDDQALAAIDRQRIWMPVDIYLGGDEHNTLHLLYSRFIYQFLHDLGATPPEISEPYRRRYSHGVILGPDGARMSKTRGNVIVPDDYIERYGADTLRCYLMFIGPFDATMTWNERALLGVKRFLDRFERFIEQHASQGGVSGRRVRASVNRLGREVSADIEAFKFNTALAKMMETLKVLEEAADAGETVANGELRSFTAVLAPFAPFLAQGCWRKLGGGSSVHTTLWPAYDPSLELHEPITIAVQVNGKLRATVQVEPGSSRETAQHAAEAMEGVAKYLREGEVTKVIFVPDRTLNYVVR